MTSRSHWKSMAGVLALPAALAACDLDGKSIGELGGSTGADTGGDVGTSTGDTGNGTAAPGDGTTAAESTGPSVVSATEESGTTLGPSDTDDGPTDAGPTESTTTDPDSDASSDDATGSTTGTPTSDGTSLNESTTDDDGPGESTTDDGDPTGTGDPPGPPDCGAGWPSETVEPIADPFGIDLGHSIQVGPAGSLHAFFHTNVEAYHAERVGAAWQVTAFTDATIHDSAGAVGDDGSVHFAYRANDIDSLRYHVRVAGVWSTETVPFGGCSASSMELADDGTVHIAGYAEVVEDDFMLCYGTRSPAGVWTTELVANGFPRGASLVLDADESAHISFYNPGHRYANNVDGAWTIENLGAGGIDSTMVGHADGTFTIGHSESPFGSILLTVGEAGAWSDEEIAASSENFHTSAPGVALAAGGALHAVHPNPTDERCLVHRERADEGAAWTISEVADDNDFLGRVTVDDEGTPHVLYFSLDGEVRHAAPAL